MCDAYCKMAFSQAAPYGLSGLSGLSGQSGKSGKQPEYDSEELTPPQGSPAFVLGSGMRGVTRDIKCFKDNLSEALVDTLVIFGIYVVVICGRAVTDKNALNVFRKLDLYVWFTLLVSIVAFMKTFYPRCEENVLNAAIFNCVRVMMTPMLPSMPPM